MRKFLLLLACCVFSITQMLAQSRVIMGKVTDAEGKPLSKASVMVKGTKLGTSTNENGQYTITVPASAQTIVISSVGQAAQEISIGSGNTINASLLAQNKNLDEVVVVAYGIQKKSNVTAAVSTVGGDNLANRPFSSVDQMLGGKVPGLLAPATTGQPGGNQQIRIRGIGSVTASSNPLYVVDGVPVNSGDLSRLATTANALAGINPNDIESVTVLKDAQATSLYGSRGSNGVILITTKKGKSGKTKFRVDMELGNNKYANVPPAARPVNASEWLTLLREGYLNAGATQAQTDAIALSYGEGAGIDANWLDLVTQTGTQQQYNVSASGGDSKTTFYLSGGYFKQQASVIGSDFKRFSATANFKHTASKNLNFFFNVSASNTLQNTPSNAGGFANPVLSSYFLRPTQNPYNADGTLNISRTGNTNFSQIYNPLYIAANEQKKLTGVQVRPNLSAELSFLKNFKLTSRFGVDYNTLEEYNYNNPFHGDGRTANGRGFAYYTRYFNWTWTNMVDYGAYLGKSQDLRVDAKIGYEAQKSKGYFINARADNFPFRSDVTLSTNASTVIDGKASGSDYDFTSVFSTASFNYKERYVLGASFRRDGSSRFSPDNRFGNFWSVGLAWNVDRESFFKIDAIDALKLRASYGLTGNAGIGNYGWRQTSAYGFNYNSQPGGAFNNPGNPDLTWEETGQLDFGLDASFLKNRINIIFDYYDKQTKSLLFADPLSRTTGFTSITRNIGTMQNKGFEFTINATPVKTKNFTWDISFNISKNQNKITKLPGGRDIIDGSFILREGYDYRSFYAREWAGVDPANGNPLWYTDSTKKSTTSSYSTAQRYINGKSASPKYYGGFSNTFTYRGIGITADFIYNYGNYITDAWIFYLIDGANPTFGKYAKTLERWQKPGDVTNVPKYIYGSTTNSSSFSSRFLQKGDFIRLRNITFGYDLPQTILTKLKLNSLHFYARGTNFWTKTYDKNLTTDPEQGVNSQSNLDILYTKSVTIGLNLGF